MKVAINGFGRIGRTLFKQLAAAGGFEVVAVNDLASADDLAYALKFDTVRGRYHEEVAVEGRDLIVGGRATRVLSERDPGLLPWRELGVELVFECTGRFTAPADLERHVEAGAAFVILSAPVGGGGDVPTLVHGVNSAAGQRIVSCASCTTNAITPVMEVLSRRFGEPGYDARDIVPIEHEGSTLRGVAVQFPEGIHSQTREQHLLNLGAPIS